MLIAFCGQKNSGKTECATITAQLMDGVVLNFADLIKDQLKLMGVDDYYLYQSKEEIIPEFGVSARALMQTHGTWMRAGYSDKCRNPHIFYLNQRLKKCKKSVIIGDLRFEDEEQFIRDHGGFIVLVNRPSLCNHDAHESEQQWKNIKYDYKIENTDGIQELKDKINALVTVKKIKKNN